MKLAYGPRKKKEKRTQRKSMNEGIEKAKKMQEEDGSLKVLDILEIKMGGSHAAHDWKRRKIRECDFDMWLFWAGNYSLNTEE
jgi:hypothetical protein